jgi:uncharacterized membrane protein
METSPVMARAFAMDQRAGRAQMLAFLSGVVGVLLLLAGANQLWQSGNLPSEIVANYLGPAMALSVLGLAAAVVAAAAWVVGAQREAAAEAMRALAD